MAGRVLLQILAAFGLALCVSAETRFFIAAPNVFRVGVEETAVVSLLGQPANVAMDVELFLRLSGSSNKLVTKTVRVQGGASEKTTLSIAPDALDPNEGQFQLMDLGASSTDTNPAFEKVAQVLVTPQSGYVFVQTDKPIYTPNQKVQIRVMSLDQSMLPSDRQIHVEIVNPKGISVKRLRDTQAADNGFLTGDYQFPPHPMFGNWSVSACYGPEFKVNSTVSFEVKEYVLPTFSVQVTPPKYILRGQTHIAIHVKSHYVFGKPVIGRCLLKVGVVGDDGEVDFSSVRREVNLNSTGEATFNLTNLNDVFGRADWFDLYENDRFHAEAIVSETSTGFTEAAISRSAIFTSSPYKFDKSRTAQYFKPALTLHVKLDLTFANGDPAPGVPVRVTAKATLRDRSQQQLQNSDVNGQVQNPNTDDNGRINFLLSVPANADSIRIQCGTQDSKFLDVNQANLNFEIAKSQSPDGAGDIVIIPRASADSSYTVGQPYSFLIQRAGLNDGVDIHYMFITAGKIVSKGVLQNEGNNPILQMVASHDMVPKTRVIVYYITAAGDVVADSLSLEVEERCRGEVSLNVLPERRPTQPTYYPPNEQVQVEVTAPAQSHVGILGIDQAVYLLRKKDLLTRRKMFDRMKGNDMGCGPGGGQNTDQIFRDTGMTVLTNANLDVTTRQDVGCAENARRRRSTSQALAECLANHRSCVNDRDKPSLNRRLEGGNWPCRRRALILKQECSLTDAAREAYEMCCVNATRNDVPTSVGARSGQGAHLEIAADTPVRDDFRETWFFDMVVIPANGKTLYNIATPGSITEWQMTAVSVSPTLGMCVADSTSITVFQNFFIQLHLPYSVVRLEQTQVVVTIFNYGLDAMTVTVIFNAPEELCISGSSNRTVHVTSQNASSTTFVVRPVKVGDFEITVLAGPGRTARDVVKKKLKVVPQGVIKRVTRSMTLNPGRVMFQEQRALTTAAPVHNPGVIGQETIFQGDSQTERFNVSLPPESIPNTESCSVNVIGNLLGTIVTDPIGGLNNLVRQPSGCGEQTMIKLAPTLFVYKYLESVGDDTPALEARVYDYLAQGVALELRYRLDSGAFSVWHTNYPGSTWLTAFVVKVFSQASQFTKVQVGHVEGSMNWIIDHNQIPSGAFEENYRVHHQEMIGAVKGEVSMTAVVLISLLEARNLLVPASQKISTAITSAKDYLEEYIDGPRPELVKVYEKAIVTYALALAKSPLAATANVQLRTSEIREPATGAVHFDPNPQNYDGSRPYWLTRRPSAISVETSAYALLAQMELGDYDYAGRIAIWLSNKQNYDGGFVSTQDTVVALQALAKYADRPEFSNIDLDCTVTSDKTQGHLLNYHIDNTNAKVQEEVDVTVAIGLPMTLRSTGSGVAKANVEIRYNSEEDDPDTCPFHINITANEVKQGDNILRLDIHVCARYERDDRTTHMSIIDVGLYSGFKAVKKDLETITNTSDLISSYELSDRSVIFYLDKIPNDEDLCLDFTARPEAIVGNIQPVPLHVYDYYDPDETCTIFYKPGAGSPLLTTLCSENECICSPDTCGNCAQDSTQAVLEAASCTGQEAYALKIRVDEVTSKGGFNIMNVTVMVPIKTGVDNVAGLEKRQLYLDSACSCPRFRRGSLYLIVGDTGLKFTMANGQEGFKYVIDESTKVEFWPASRPRRNNSKARRFDKLAGFQRDMTINGCPS